MSSPHSAVVLLAGEGESTSIVGNALRQQLGDVPAIIEERVSKKTLLFRRFKKLGATTVVGQVAFMASIQPLLSRRSAGRKAEIIREHGLNIAALRDSVHHVVSANEAEAHAHLRRLNPRVVVVNGTRILSKATLQCVDAVFINMHAGITPFCRGVHGGYWALADQRPDLVGTTVHLVDQGIDTGQVLAQATFTPTPADSFATYPILHTAFGLPLLIEAVKAALEGRLEHKASIADGPSKLRTHPTIWGYAWNRLAAGVR